MVRWLDQPAHGTERIGCASDPAYSL